MEAFGKEIKTHYPVMTERQVAARWKVSLKTMRRWPQDKVGPAWYKLFHSVRYHGADVFDFEQQCAQHWLTIRGDRERVPRIVSHPPKVGAAPEVQDIQPDPAVRYVSAKEVADATGLPIHLFQDRIYRDRKRIPHLMLVGNLRFSLEAILQWELRTARRESRRNRPMPFQKLISSLKRRYASRVGMRSPWNKLEGSLIPLCA